MVIIGLDDAVLGGAGGIEKVKPYISIVRPVCVGEQCCLRNVSNLQVDTDDAGHIAERTTVRGDLLIDVADEADLQLFVQKLRGVPVEMRADATYICGWGIPEIFQ